MTAEQNRRRLALARAIPTPGNGTAARANFYNSREILHLKAIGRLAGSASGLRRDNVRKSKQEVGK
jgi:hypothetical protein